MSQEIKSTEVEFGTAQSSRLVLGLWVDEDGAVLATTHGGQSKFPDDHSAGEALQRILTFFDHDSIKSGWGLFDRGYGQLFVERDDEAALLESDDDAIVAAVRRLNEISSGIQLSALTLMKQYLEITLRGLPDNQPRAVDIAGALEIILDMLWLPDLTVMEG
jgi:hypothetical protein